MDQKNEKVFGHFLRGLLSVTLVFGNSKELFMNRKVQVLVSKRIENRKTLILRTFILYSYFNFKFFKGVLPILEVLLLLLSEN